MNSPRKCNRDQTKQGDAADRSQKSDERNEIECGINNALLSPDKDTEQFEIRMTVEEIATLALAAHACDMKLNDFVIQEAVNYAEQVLFAQEAINYDDFVIAESEGED